MKTIDEYFLEHQIQLRKQINGNYKCYYDIDDIMQDIYLYMKEREHKLSFDCKQKFINYAMQIALTNIKAITKHKHSMVEFKVDIIEEEEINNYELAEFAYEKIKELDFIEEAIIKAKLYHNISYTELAKQLGMCRSKVYNIHKEALKKLKNIIC